MGHSRITEHVYLQVDAEANAQQSRAMGVFRMPGAAISNLSKGNQITLYVHNPEGVLEQLPGRMTLRALTAFVPAVLRAVRAHNDSDGGRITHVVLPAHDVSAYYKMFGWMRASIHAGKVLRPKRVNVYALEHYKELKALAEDLSIGYLANAMEGRLTAMMEGRKE